MSFFDSYDKFLSTSTIGATAARLNGRYKFLVDQNRSIIEGKRILDIGSHDGRWAFAALDAGCSHIIGIEPRDHLVSSAIENLSHYGVGAERYEFLTGDAFEILAERSFDVDTVFVFGFFYHIHRHTEFVDLLRSVRAKNIILDTTILPDHQAPDGLALVRLAEEPTDDEGNAFGGEPTAVIGFPSRAAIRLLFSRAGYHIEEIDWSKNQQNNSGIEDYSGGVRAAFRLTLEDASAPRRPVPVEPRVQRVDVAPLRERLPQGMLQLRLPELSLKYTGDAMRALIRRSRAVNEASGPRSAIAFLMKDVVADLSSENNESYFGEAFEYYLGLLSGYANEPSSMAQHIRQSKTMPAPEDDLIFSDHVNMSHVTRGQQLAAMSRGVPSVIMASMPRSASGTLTATLSSALGAPVLHWSIGRFPNYHVVPGWCDAVVEGGAVLHDHFSASDFNLGVISGRPVRTIFVLIRDPRAAARSQVHFKASEYLDPDESIEARIEREYLSAFIPWLSGWLEAVKKVGPNIKIHFVKFADVVSDITRVHNSMVSVMSEDNKEMRRYVSDTALSETRRHFVSGDDNAWRSEVSAEVAQRMWAATPENVRQLLSLRP